MKWIGIMVLGAEFIKRFGEVPPEELHPFRVKRWFDICDQVIRENGEMPAAWDLYQDALSALSANTND